MPVDDFLTGGSSSAAMEGSAKSNDAASRRAFMNASQGLERAYREQLV